MKFLDIHTHRKESPQASGCICNVSSDFTETPDTGYYSMGLHPWDIQAFISDYLFEQLRASAAKDNVLAIGECGLDKICDADYGLQEYFFKKQILLANALAKPLIIHCVRAYDDVLNLLQANQVSVPVIFHGFNKSRDVAKTLLDSGYYLSFGNDLLQNKSLQETFAGIPVNRIFLETDDAEVSICDIYYKAIFVRGMDLVSFQEAIRANVMNVFKLNISGYDE